MLLPLLSLCLLLSDLTSALPARSPGRPASSSQAHMALAGCVTTPDSTLLAGVSILVQGSLTGTTTNAEGRFLLPSTPLPCTLVFTLTGYATKTLAVTEAADLLAPVVLRSVRPTPVRPGRRPQ